MTPSPDALTLRGLRVTPPAQGRGGAGAGRPVLEGLDLRVAPGETVALLGRSGAGKSVTVRTILGLHPRGWTVEGEIQVGSTTVDPADAAATRRLRLHELGVVLQDPRAAFNPVRTIGDFVTEAALERAIAPGVARDQAAGLLAEVGLPDPLALLERYPHELSGGMLQRASIAAALSGEPALVIADEPTAALDVLTQAEVVATLDRAQADHGFGLLFVTHDLALAAAVADRVVVLSDGRIVDDLPATTLDAATHPATRALVEAGAATSVHARRAAPASRADAPPAVVARNLTRRFGAATAADDVSLSIARGRTLALVGGSGSGKSTLARIVAGLDRADSGTVEQGHADASVRRAPRIQMVFQDPALSLDPRLTAVSAVARALAATGVARRERDGRARALLASVGLTDATAERRPHELSGGQCQRVSIARALALDPAVLVLDEATSALDPEIRVQLLDLLARLQQELGLALLLITHDLGVVARLADEVVVLHRGRVVETGPAASVIADPQADYTRLLLEALPHRGWRPEELAGRRRALEAGGRDVVGGGRAQGLAGELQRL